MKIYKMEADLDNKYISFLYYIEGNSFCEEFNVDICKGILMSNKFNSIDLGRPVEEQMEKGKVADCSKLWNTTGVYVFSQKARDCLEKVFGNHVEFIPAKFQDRIYYILNVLNVIDAIDYDNSEFRVLKSGAILGVEKFSFDIDKIRSNTIFKILLEGRIHSTEVFVSQEVKNIVEEKGLIGFSFKEVWREN